MAQLLAGEMKVKLQFIPFEQDDLIAQLDAGLFDVGMAGVPVTTPRLEKTTFSEPYIETALCFIVPDYRRNEFSTAESIKRIPKLIIAMTITGYFFEKLKAYLPQAEIIPIKSARDFFEADEGQYDALFYDAERGAAITLMYPKYQAVAPLPDIARVPLAYPVAGRDREFADFLSQWINLKKSGLQFPQLYDHWILGKDAVPKYPRWSIIRDVLKWVE